MKVRSNVDKGGAEGELKWVNVRDMAKVGRKVRLESFRERVTGELCKCCLHVIEN